MTIPKEAHIRWNIRQSEDNPELAKWFFLIVNYSREIETYQSRILEHLQMIDELREFRGKIKDSNLEYNLLTFNTRKGEINWSEIYNGKIRKDANLYERKGKLSLEDYVSEQLS
ncbi:hypothetical protein COU53_03040 [Candidatus Pacearchaeota archaeon CG10_big_fil_rev_8_21_14_0_10_30_48]|nr:MAG: hypothetical protein COU53_03040 [Candidatus Pacearchaeota archaeon CG10_big_fil_rev_8_21_14_0_10_30_48]